MKSWSLAVSADGEAGMVSSQAAIVAAVSGGMEVWQGTEHDPWFKLQCPMVTALST